MRVLALRSRVVATRSTTLLQALQGTRQGQRVGSLLLVLPRHYEGLKGFELLGGTGSLNRCDTIFME
jgi:hypothetical protein